MPRQKPRQNQNWCEKYRAVCFTDIKGQNEGVEKIKNFVRNFPAKKAIILQGPVGTGKTSLIHALANEMNFEILELNASDLRNREQLEKILKPAVEQKSLTKTGKIILVDEVDGVTATDYGGLSELNRLIHLTKFPIFITANDIWQSKFKELRKKSELIQLKEVDYKIIFLILENIAKAENSPLKYEDIKAIAIKAKGDVRAAINDLQTASIMKSTGEDISILSISERDKEQDIFNALKQVFKTPTNLETLRIFDNVNMPIEKIALWLEKNIPEEYSTAEELAKAHEALSKADIFKGRIYKQQYWRFSVYQNILLSAGISSAKKQINLGFTKYNKPDRILKIWLSNKKNEQKKSIAQKYGKFTHCSKKRAIKEFHFLKYILKNPRIQKQLKLNEKEIEYINNLN